MRKIFPALVLLAAVGAFGSNSAHAAVCLPIPGTACDPDQLIIGSPDTFTLGVGDSFYISFTVPSSETGEITLTATAPSVFDIYSTLGGATTYENLDVATTAYGFYSTGSWVVQFDVVSDPMGSVGIFDLPENDLNSPAFVTPLPDTLPLFATGLAALGLFGWRMKRRGAAPLFGA